MTRGDRFAEAAKNWMNAEKGRSVLQLCRSVGITEQTYYNWLKDATPDISAEKLMKFALLTRFHPTWLWSEDGPKMLANDERVSGLLSEIHDLHDNDYQSALDYVRLLKAARNNDSKE